MVCIPLPLFFIVKKYFKSEKCSANRVIHQIKQIKFPMKLIKSEKKEYSELKNWVKHPLMHGIMAQPSSSW